MCTEIFDLKTPSFLTLVGPLCKQRIGAAYNVNFSRTLIGQTDSFDICVMSRDGRTANGMTWDENSKECFVIDDAIDIDKTETSSQSCIFQSRF